MGRITNIACAGLASLVLAQYVGGVSQAWAADPADAVGTAGSVTVTVADIKRILASASEEQRKQILSNPNQLRTLINRELTLGLILNDAKAKKIDQQPDVVARLETARRDILVESYIRAALPLSSVQEPGDVEIRLAYENNKASLFGPRQYHIAQIAILGDPNADAAGQQATEAKKNAVMAKLKAKGADFAAIAKTDSDQAETASKGGEVGIIPEDRLPPQVRQTLAGMTKGAISEPLRLPADGGWHIFKLIDVIPPRQLTLEEVRPQIVQKLKEQKYNAQQQQFTDDLLKKNNPIIVENGMAKLAEPAAAAPAPLAPPK